MFDKNQFLPNTLPALMLLYARHDMINDIYTMYSSDIEKYINHLENCLEFFDKKIESSNSFKKEKKKNILDFFSQERNIIISGESYMTQYEYVAVLYDNEDSYNLSPHLTKNINLDKIELLHSNMVGYHIRLMIHKDCLMINQK